MLSLQSNANRHRQEPVNCPACGQPRFSPETPCGVCAQQRQVLAPPPAVQKGPSGLQRFWEEDVLPSALFLGGTFLCLAAGFLFWNCEIAQSLIVFGLGAVLFGLTAVLNRLNALKYSASQK